MASLHSCICADGDAAALQFKVPAATSAIITNGEPSSPCNLFCTHAVGCATCNAGILLCRWRGDQPISDGGQRVPQARVGAETDSARPCWAELLTGHSSPSHRQWWAQHYIATTSHSRKYTALIRCASAYIRKHLFI